jgi:hypothetical protein
MWSSVKPLPGAEQLIQKLVAKNIPFAVPSHFNAYELTNAVGYIIPPLEISLEDSAFTRRLLRPLPSR